MKIRGNTVGTTIKPEKNLVKATNLTYEEQAQARRNIGAMATEDMPAYPIVVNLLSNGTASYSSEEIYEAYNHGSNVQLDTNTSIIPLTKAEPGQADFTLVLETGEIFIWRINADYTCTFVETDYVTAERLVGVNTPQGGVVFNDLYNNEAGELAAVFGEESKAWGKASLAAGTKKTRSGGSETVSGDVYYTEAVGSASMASGMGAIAFSRASKSLGYRTQTGYPPSAEWIEKRNGVTVKVDAQGNNVFPADNVGQGAVAFGSDTVALENHTFAGGYRAKAIATVSFSYGSDTVTRGNCAVAMGSHTEANEECAVAFGANAKAERKWSFAANNGTQARGNCSAAFGDGTVTAQQYDENGNNILNNPGYSQMVVGRYNAYENGEIDSALFVVGNGVKDEKTKEVTRSNAFIVDRNGNANVAGNLSFGSIAETSARKVRQVLTGSSISGVKGSFDGQMFLLNTSGATAVYVWSTNINNWIKIGSSVKED